MVAIEFPIRKRVVLLRPVPETQTPQTGPLFRKIKESKRLGEDVRIVRHKKYSRRPVHLWRIDVALPAGWKRAIYGCKLAKL